MIINRHYRKQAVLLQSVSKFDTPSVRFLLLILISDKV